MSRLTKALLIVWCVFLFVVSFVVGARNQNTLDVQGARLEVNGEPVNIDGATNVVIQSSHTVTNFGDVIVTNNSVTVTVWLKSK